MFKNYRKSFSIVFALIVQILNAQNKLLSLEDYLNEYNALKTHKFVNTPVIKTVFEKNYHIFNGEADQALRAQRTNWDKNVQARFTRFTSAEISKAVLDESTSEGGFINLLKIIKMKAELIASDGFYVNNQYYQTGDLLTSLFISYQGNSHSFTKFQYDSLKHLSVWFFKSIYPFLVKNTFPKLRLKFIHLLMSNSFVEDAFNKFGGYYPGHPLQFSGSEIKYSDGFLLNKKHTEVCEELYLDIFSQLNADEIFEFSELARNFGTRYEHQSNRYQHCLSFLFQKKPDQIELILEDIDLRLNKYTHPQQDDRLDILALFERVKYFRNTILILKAINFESPNYIDESMSREVKLINFLEKNVVDRFLLAVDGSITDREDESELLMPLPLTDYYLGSHFKSYKPSDRTSLRDQISEHRSYWLSTLDKYKLRKVTDRLHDILKLEHTFGFKNLLVDVNKLQLLKLPTHSEVMMLSGDAQAHARLHLVTNDFDDSDLKTLQELASYLAMMQFLK